jgi:hypothetical protein
MEEGMLDQELAKQDIEKTCLSVMRSKKARFSEQIAAAQLLAGIHGLYGPGRPKVSAKREQGEDPVEINNRARGSGSSRLDSILERVNAG